MNTKAALNTILAIAEAVRTAGEIPSGHLYALSGLDMSAYQGALRVLQNAGLVSERAHLLRWTGPALGA